MNPAPTPTCAVCGHATGRDVGPCASCGADRPLQGHDADRPLRGPAGGRRASALFGPVVAFAAFTALLVVLGAGELDANRGLDAMRLGNAAIFAVGVLGAALLWPHLRPTLGRPRVTPAGAGLALAGLALVWLTAHLLGRVAPNTEEALLAVYHAQGLSLWAALVDLAILPAVGEELVFRGVVLSGLLVAFRPQSAVVTSAVLFGALHQSPLSMAHLTMLGVVLGAVRVGGRSLYPCVALHALYNALIVLGAW